MKRTVIILLFLAILFSGTIKANAQNTEAAELFSQGVNYYKLNKIEDSINSFKKAIEIDPKFYEAYYNLAHVQESRGYQHYDEAISTYEKLVEIMPEDYESMFGLGNLLYKRGYLSKSLTYLDRIPDYSEYYDKATKLIDVVEKRQVEWAAEQKLRESTLKRSFQFENVQSPSGVAVDSDGNVYAASFSQNTVYKITPQNVKSVFVGPAVLSGPVGIAVDANNNVYIANHTKGNVIKAAPNGKTKVLLLMKKPYYLNVDNQNKKLIITEWDKNSIVKFDLTGED